MHIAIVAIGSRGDVQPFIALAVALKRAGHEVKLVTTANFETLIAEYGIPLHPLPSDFQKIMEGEIGRGLVESGSNPIEMLRKSKPMIDQILSEAFEAFLDAFNDIDLIVSGNGVTFGMVSFAEKCSVPLVHVVLQPMHETSEFPNILFPVLPFKSGLYNRMTTRGMLYIMWKLIGPFVNKARTERLGLPAQTFDEMMAVINRSTVLMAYSPRVAPPASDWGDNVYVTGWWFLDHAQDWQPPADLVDFLNAGEKPVYIGFGSMNTADPHATAQMVLEALKKSGQRGVLLKGWGGLSVNEIPDTVYMIEAIPHDWLFPRMAAVVHHGGAGTTAAALRSGVPSTVVPFVADQPYWGKRSAALGVGLPPIPVKQMTVDTLAYALKRMTGDSAMRQRAASLGQTLRDENGLMRAVRLIEQAGD